MASEPDSYVTYNVANTIIAVVTFDFSTKTRGSKYKMTYIRPYIYTNKLILIIAKLEVRQKTAQVYRL